MIFEYLERRFNVTLSRGTMWVNSKVKITSIKIGITGENVGNAIGATSESRVRRHLHHQATLSSGGEIENSR